MSSFSISALLYHPWAMIIDAIGLLLLTGYHVYLSWILRHTPHQTHRGRSSYLRHAWVKTLREKDKDILAIQTMRNWVMSATLFASTSMVIGLGIMQVSFTSEKIYALSQALSFFPPVSDLLIKLKLLALAGVFFNAFLHFSLALRYYNQSGFLINLPANYFEGDADLVVSNVLNLAGNQYHNGTRIFLIATPFTLWIIGPDWFLVGVFIVLWLLYRFDFHNSLDTDQQLP
ncbi:DUF599 domain-containing protein [Chromatium okenii]|jgi:uncharacterized membrane protein|uniref:DUF599 domain-containing protein n=1 Tax=Chromatium okenii TaxID=61644 RepID=UPI0026EC482F|nr:DUF599 domain-containing protein [Chromatium okenii]MBV5309866.1 DUF599 domain-containing protein [Chromatium okenii]